MALDMFDRIANAETFESSPYIEPGLYSLQISRIAKGEKRTTRVPYVAVECKVLGSSNPKFAVGSTLCWFVDMGKDAGPGNIKSFLAVANDCPLEQVDKAGAAMCICDNSPLVGKVLDCEAYNKPTREGKPFTRVKWLKAGTLKTEQAA